MSQAEIGTIDPTDTSGVELAALLTAYGPAALSTHSGATAPSYAVKDMLWVDTTSSTATKLKVYDGAQWITVATWNTTTHAVVSKAAFSAHKNGTDQTGIVTGTPTKVTYPAEIFDIGGYYDATNGIWTPPAGPVTIQTGAQFNANVVDQAVFFISLYKNGASYKIGNVIAASGNSNLLTVGSWVDLANGSDAYEIYVQGNGLGNKSLIGVAANTYFMGASL